MTDNEATLRFSGRVGFEKATSYAWFVTDGLLQHLLHGLKYKGKREIGTYLGSRFAADLSRSNWADGIDIIIPVPLHRTKQAQRGYNQSMVIAEAMAKEQGIVAVDNILRRIRDTETQTNKTRAERTENMTGAFKIDDPMSLRGKHILLIDDVLTTGATLEACAHALHMVADVKISIATIGIAIS
jgi:ComF family protein